jgi:type III secretory pathway component EscS
MDLLVFVLAIAIVISVLAFIIGLFKVLFQKNEDKAFGLKLLIYSTIAIIIGFGSCAGIMSFGGL